MSELNLQTPLMTAEILHCQQKFLYNLIRKKVIQEREMKCPRRKLQAATRIKQKLCLRQNLLFFHNTHLTLGCLILSKEKENLILKVMLSSPYLKGSKIQKYQGTKFQNQNLKKSHVRPL